MSKRKASRRRSAPIAIGGSWLRPLVVVLGTALFAGAAIFFLRGDAPGAPSANAPAYTPPVRGNVDAPVTIVEYGDFQCPSCGAFTRSVEPELIRRYVETGKVKLIFRHFPWIGAESKRAAEAASCAGAQGQFWEYHDLLYANQHGENSGFFSSDNLKRFATQLSLDRSAFDPCLDQGLYRAAVEADFQEVRRLGFNSTPTFLVNGQRVVGAQPFAIFASVIEAQLAGR